MFGLYALATLALTYPLAFRLRSHVPLSNGDLWVNLWSFWWWRTALFELGTSPYASAYVFHPDGVSLAAHAHSPLNVLATLPVSLAWGVETAHNAALLLAFPLAALGAYLLVRELTGEPRAAFLAGLLYAFTPMHFEQTLDHVDVASVEFAPLFVLFLLRVCRRGGAGNAVGLALAWAGNALVTWYHGLIALLVGAAILGREGMPRWRRRPLRTVLRDLAGAALLGGALVAPFAWPMLTALSRAGGEPVPFWASLGVDPALWLLPSDHHPVLGRLTADLYARIRLQPITSFLPYLGWVPVSLALAALARRRWGGAERILWGGLLAALLLLALGKHPTVAGRTYEAVWLPHAAFEHVPLLGRLRVANRFQLWAFVPLAVLCGHALAALFRSRRTLLAWCLGGLVVFEYLSVPYPTQPAARDPFWDTLARDPDAGAVLPIPLPFDARYSEALYDQTRHGRPIVGGYVSYAPGEAMRTIRSDPFLLGATGRGGRPPERLDPDALRRIGVGTVVVYLDRTDAVLRRRRLAAHTPYELRAWHPLWGFPHSRLQWYRSLLRDALGEPIYADARIEAYRVPGLPRPDAGAGGGRFEAAPNPG